jgi:hypothetical protein
MRNDDMAGTNKQVSLDQPAVYEIQIQGRLGDDWAIWFGTMAIAVERDTTTLTGSVADQAALHGVLVKIRDLGLPLLSVRLLEQTIKICE